MTPSIAFGVVLLQVLILTTVAFTTSPLRLTRIDSISTSFNHGRSNKGLHAMNTDDDEQSVEVPRRMALGKVATMAFTATMGTVAATTTPVQAEDLNELATTLSKENAINSKGTAETHMPFMTVNGQMVTVEVPPVADPKSDYVQYIWLKDTYLEEVVVVRAFDDSFTGPPTLKVKVPKGTRLQPYAFYSSSGLWEGESAGTRWLF